MAQLITGSAIALLAFLLAIGWEAIRETKKRSRRDQALLTAAIAEIEAVRAAAVNDLNLVSGEHHALREYRDDVANPLDPLDAGFWDAIKYDPPEALTRIVDSLAKVRDVVRRINQLNEMIRAREAFKANQAQRGTNTSLSGLRHMTR